MRKVTRCRVHRKHIYPTYEKADGVGHRLGKRKNKMPSRVIFCAETGGYHITGMTKAEYDRSQAWRKSG